MEFKTGVILFKVLRIIVNNYSTPSNSVKLSTTPWLTVF